jgi:hypothetical protein
MVVNLPTLAIDVDYQKTCARVWYMRLRVKLFQLGMPIDLLKIMEPWLNNRRAFVVFGEVTSNKFNIFIGLPQGSSLSPYLCVIVYCDFINFTEAQSGQLFADDLNASKTVAQLFHSQVEISIVNITISRLYLDQ